MTQTPTSAGASPAADPAVATASQAQARDSGRALQARLRQAIDSLNIALESANLAIEMVKEAPDKAAYARLEPAQVLETWRANNLLLAEVIDNLYYQGRHSLGVFGEMLIPE